MWGIKLSVIGYSSLAFIGLAVMTLVYTAGKSPPTEPPKRGSRGLKRARALAEGGSFKTVEPAMRLVASWVAPLPLPKMRRAIDQQLVWAGDWLGLTANEFLGLSVLSGVLFLAIGIVFCDVMALSFAFGIFFGGVGAFFPWFRVTGESADRFKSINRALPTAIDLASLCMGAGLDFPGAIRQVVDKAAAKEDPLTEELGRILQELELGRTRRQALENFADRVPTDAVKDFVGTVVQAEEKGNPLAEVLRIQARMARLRRSIMAEEAAAKAAVRLMGPLVLLFGAIILILLGPFIIQGMRSGI
jgi:tight adherence protein C